MPSKSHKAASRQSKLSKKKRRDKARTQVFDVGPTESSAESVTPVVEAPVEDAEAEMVAQAPALQPASRPLRTARHPVSEHTPTNPYLASEIRRIAVMTSLIVAALVALTFVLR